ncbi:4'-phosphopantetheinyl transferase superfamily protein [Vibrio mediterranei]|uniref:4'-phosphopantetheinyl transferase family protein n=1 Tax=Vibrio mediterranei TaxID=689 RepID=UPI001EFEB904|nr:4'-phosphopantetheinyl transferase superfamily protein [Vibrio mediterranei]MCG9629018.1 4'-phosphopantetheinyl transferase superfamily protein [Vibrio mediterranei]
MNMFTATSTSSISPSPFITSVEVGIVSSTPDLHYCYVTFDSSKYCNGLFDLLEIPFPVMLISSVFKRRSEYLAARYAAQCLLKTTGCRSNVGTSHNREPIWPLGFCGSLSHTDNKAIALLCSERSGLLPGVDIETFTSSTMKDIENVFTTEEEQSILKFSNLSYELALMIVFSTKESLFKAIYPDVRKYFGFELAKVVSFDDKARKITLCLTKDLSRNQRKGKEFTGTYFFDENKVITMLTDTRIVA